MEHLRVFADKSEFHSEDGKVEVYLEGPITVEAKKRQAKITSAFSQGFLANTIQELVTGKETIDLSNVSDDTINAIDDLVDSVTSEIGRALIGLSVMQLAIKAIEPAQSIRLHKGGLGGRDFSWREGISMRTLDKKYVTPVLRQYDLLRLNADGFMMTRTLAENYPYTTLYKAKIRGAKDNWLVLVDDVETNTSCPVQSLRYLLSKLLNAAEDFSREANDLIELLDGLNGVEFSLEDVIAIIKTHINKSDYAARLLEIGMHSFAQTACESGALGSLSVKPLSQMRSANKKHGNIGDIEFIEHLQIVESWDAKFGKSYLREEIEEACEKISSHELINRIGFVTDSKALESEEIKNRIEELEALHDIKIEILTFDDWASRKFEDIAKVVGAQPFPFDWLYNYASYFCQKRRDVAPIDEPCKEWVRSLKEILGSTK